MLSNPVRICWAGLLLVALALIGKRCLAFAPASSLARPATTAARRRSPPLYSTVDSETEQANAAPPADPAAVGAASPAGEAGSSVEGSGSGASVGPCQKFPKCDGAMRAKGCDGSGKIQGGIATVPGLGWWPIKAYRPCPAAIEAGYGYKRKGQTFGEFIEGKRRSDDE